VQELQELLERSGARATVEAEIERLGLETREALDRLAIADDVKVGLGDLVSGLIARKHYGFLSIQCLSDAPNLGFTSSTKRVDEPSWQGFIFSKEPQYNFFLIESCVLEHDNRAT